MEYVRKNGICWKKMGNVSKKLNLLEKGWDALEKMGFDRKR